MQTLESTPRRVNGLKSYSVTAHNLPTAKYGLTLASKPKENLCASASAYKFDDLEEAKKVGEAFLVSDFKGIFAHKEFIKDYYKK